jgi:hypothetical protein
MQTRDAARGDGNGAALAADMLSGAIAGGIAVWVMDQVDWYMDDHQSAEARRRTRSVRPAGMDPAHRSVALAAEAVGLEAPAQPNAMGVAVHYGLGIGPGAVYGALRDRAPMVGAGRGLLYGFGLFALQDEMINAATGLAADPRRYPWQAHARGLVAHLVYGLVTDAVLTALKGWGRPVRYARDEAPGAAAVH